MTPKQKAKELFSRYSNFFTIWDIEKDIPILHEKNIDDVIQCALIAVDEVISVIENGNPIETQWNYWNEVKQEIEKL